MSKIALVLFNLGGPDKPQAVRPFLFNLFKDPAIIGAPNFIRYPLAAFISTTRAKRARANYAIMGGGSPILPQTLKQAHLLESRLGSRRPDDQVRAFVCMRYWVPLAVQTAAEVASFAPDEIVLLPLYPQFSTTTTGSSLRDWTRVYGGLGRSRSVCCYPTAEGLIASHVEAIRETWNKAGCPQNVRLLFSAHGLPQQVIERGDPYQAQIRATAAAIAERLPELGDWTVSYQSRVGPLKWLGPSTEQEIRRAGAEGKGVLIDPIAFVSEHIETLVELDREYAEIAMLVGCSPYLRAPAMGADEQFIGALVQACETALMRSGGVEPASQWFCPATHSQCPRTSAARGAEHELV